VAPDSEPRDAATVNDASLAPVDTGDGGNSVASLDSLRFAAYPDPPYPVENPHTRAKALLGKVLFWEEQLSGDDTVACGTCHRAGAGGSDPRSADASAHLPGPDGVFDTADDTRGSPGIVACDETGTPTTSAVQVTGRKAPSYLDAMFAQRLFWDGRAECATEGCSSIDAFEDPDNPGTFPIAMFGALENQAVAPPLSTVEMACEGTTWPDLHRKLETAAPLALARELPDEIVGFIAQNGGSYPEMFRAAFGSEQTSGPDDEINTRRIAFAIATHERRSRSNQTPWDLFNAGDDEALTPVQIRGLHVFRERARCSSCHLPPLFGDGAFHFTGFHRPSLDPGREGINGRPSDRGEMRTPTLRNVGLRVQGGLLHTGAGVGSSLESVIDTYVQGGLRDDPEVVAVPITESVEPLDLTQDEIDDLIDFLVHGLTDPRVAAELPPFDRPRLGSE
jgi:cytochrome c peroxidase